MYDIATIINNYNSSKLTQECIDSIVEKTAANLNYQIIVVDNCSQIADYKLLEEFCESHSYKNIKLVRSKINTGFGGGNMSGYHYANAKYIAFVNNDTLFLNDCFSILKTAIEKHYPDLEYEINIINEPSGKEHYIKQMRHMGYTDNDYEIKRLL